MNKGWFITGTDTGVGKTWVSQLLLRQLNALGYVSVGYKPVATGAIMTPQGWCHEDVMCLQAASGIAVTTAMINPYCFSTASAPHILSAKENHPIDFSVITANFNQLSALADYVVVEGAGGWLTPLTEHTTFADWVIQLNLPVILVVDIKVGCLNHALMTMAMIRSAGLMVSGWVANRTTIMTMFYLEYIQALQDWLHAPLLGQLSYGMTEKDFTFTSPLDIQQILAR